MTDWRDDPEFQRELAEDRLYVDVSEHLAQALEVRGKSRAQLAEMCGVSRSAMTQRLSGANNLTLKVVADTLHALGYGLEVALVDRRNGNKVHRLRDYEAEHRHATSGSVIQLSARRGAGNSYRTRGADVDVAWG